MTDWASTFRILHVCTGNICRSPMAERLTRSRLDEHLGDAAARFHVESAGTWGHAGSPMEVHAAQALAEFGVADGGFRARELVAQHVADADLVLAATREHRVQAITLSADALKRTFTLREFARLASFVAEQYAPWPEDPVERATALVAAAAASRGKVRPRRPGDDDVADPYGAPFSAFRQCAREIALEIDQVVSALVGAREVGRLRRQ